MNGIRLVDVVVNIDDRGSLALNGQAVPHNIGGAFLLRNIKSHLTFFEAEMTQTVFCLHGSLTVVTTEGRRYAVDDLHSGIVIPAGYEAQLIAETSDTVLQVFTSAKCDMLQPDVMNQPCDVVYNGVDLGFDIKNAYVIFDVAADAIRGDHAHTAGYKQSLDVVLGSCHFLMEPIGSENVNLRVNQMSDSVPIHNHPVWLTLDEFTPQAVVQVFTSAPYDENHYMRRDSSGGRGEFDPLVQAVMENV